MYINYTFFVCIFNPFPDRENEKYLFQLESEISSIILSHNPGWTGWTAETDPNSQMKVDLRLSLDLFN